MGLLRREAGALEGVRMAATMRSPFETACSVRARPRPVLAPLMSQVLGSVNVMFVGGEGRQEEILDCGWLVVLVVMLGR